MFDYEHELRIVAHDDTTNTQVIKGEFGYQMPFNPSELIEAIVVHPEADESFNEVVLKAVETYAPDITNRVRWSSMRESPPLILTGE